MTTDITIDLNRKELKTMIKAMKLMHKLQINDRLTTKQAEHAHNAYDEMQKLLNSTPKGRDVLDWYEW